MTTSPGDGHCLLYTVITSLYHQLSINMDLHALKCHIFIEIVSNLDHYLGFLSNGKLQSELRQYIIYKRYDTALGDILPLVIANCLLINLIILDERKSNTFQQITITPSRQTARGTITVHRSEDHYNGLRTSLHNPHQDYVGLHRQPTRPVVTNSNPDITLPERRDEAKDDGLNMKSALSSDRIHRQPPRPVDTPRSSGRLSYTSNELKQLRPQNMKIPRDVRKSIFACNIWKPKVSKRPHDKNSGVHHDLLRKIPIQKSGASESQTKCLLQNSRSVRNKASSIREYIIDRHITMALVTETWLKPDENDIIKDLTPDGFSYLGKNRLTGRGGGVAIIHKDTLDVRETVNADYSTFEHLSVTVTNKASSNLGHLTLIYRPPSSSIPTFLEELESHLVSLSDYAGELLLTGDINFHLDTPNSNTNRLLNLLDEHGVKQWVDKPTHKDGHILDIVASPSSVSNISVDASAISDHSAITWDWDKLTSNSSINEPVQYECRLLRNFSEESFHLDLEKKLSSINMDQEVDKLCTEYTTSVTEIYNNHAPLVTKSAKRFRTSPWITPEIKAARLLRRTNEKIWRRSKLEVHREIYCQHRDDVNRLIQEAKQQHYQERLATRDPKATFQVINELTKTSSVHLPAPPSTDLCNQFINFFANKISTIQIDIKNLIITENLPTDVSSDIKVNNFQSMEHIRPITQEELSSLLKASNSKTNALDPCPTDLLKRTFSIHSDLVINIFNKSFAEGVFPSAFKLAQVTPLLKQSSLDKHIFKNYRPVSNLPSLGKLLERVGVTRLNEHLHQSGKIEIYQSAYKPGHSTETALLKVFNDIALHLDSGKMVLLAMIDLSAAFDTICHIKLARLLQYEYGISGTALSWYRSYFDNRHQLCKIGRYKSREHQLTVGCPQGSVMGPIAYNLYTAPLERILLKHAVQYHKYADDLQVYLSCDPENINQTKTILESCIAEVRSWMLRWGLRINDNKTEFIVFKNPTRSPQSVSALQIAGCQITPSEKVKNLGAVFDSCLSRSPHISKVVKSCNFHLRQLGRIRRYITPDSCKRAVHALIISRLDYCNSLLADAPATLVDKLQLIQNRAARLILLSSQRGFNSVTPLLRQLSWLPVTLRIKFKLCVLVFKCLNGSAPVYLSDLVKRHKRDARLRQPPVNDLQKQVSKRKIGKSAFLVAAPSAWNDLPPKLKLEKDLLKFRKGLKTHLWIHYFSAL